jgi:hypothetical protein
MDMTFPTGWPHEDLRGPHVGIEGLLRQRIHGRYFLAAPHVGRDLGARAGTFNPARPLHLPAIRFALRDYKERRMLNAAARRFKLF